MEIEVVFKHFLIYIKQSNKIKLDNHYKSFLNSFVLPIIMIFFYEITYTKIFDEE